MTSQQVELIRESFTSVREASGPIAMLFYGRLFDLDPSLRAMFQIDMRQQSKKLMDMLGTVVDSLDHFEELRPMLRELGQLHIAYGVKADQYETLSRALIWAFGQALDRDFYPEVRAAWAAAVGAISEEMLSGSPNV